MTSTSLEKPAMRRGGKFTTHTTDRPRFHVSARTNDFFRTRLAPDVRSLLVDLPKALRRWDASDPAMARLVRKNPIPPRPASRGSGFAALATSITHQQVSLAAGRTIWKRVEAACGGRVTPANALAAGPTRLRAAGLSRGKTAYVLDLAERTLDGRLDFRRFGRLSDAEVVRQLTAVKGVGVWTAEMFLLFHEERPDVLAVGDLGLQLGAVDAFGVPRERAKRFLEDRRADWSPYGSLASLALWDARHRLGKGGRRGDRQRALGASRPRSLRSLGNPA